MAEDNETDTVVVTWHWGPDADGDEEDYRLTMLNAAEFKLECMNPGDEEPWREIRDPLLLAKRVVELDKLAKHFIAEFVYGVGSS